MILSSRRQRGEGKIGCIVSLVVLVSVGAVALKVVPILWSDNELKDAAKDIASRASVLPVLTIETQLKAKARELEIREALAPGAIQISKVGTSVEGNCTIALTYKRKVDLYGIYQWEDNVQLSVTSPYLNAN